MNCAVNACQKNLLEAEIRRLQAALDGRIEAATNLQMECERLRTALQTTEIARKALEPGIKL